MSLRGYIRPGSRSIQAQVQFTILSVFPYTTMLLSFVQVFTILAATAQAVDVGGFTTLGCRQRALSTCLNWPQGTCCEFVSHRSRPSNDHLATQSVGMQNLHECDLGTWNWPANNAHSHGNPSGQCGTVRDRVLGPASTACMSEVSRHSSTGDGAMWLVLPALLHVMRW